MPDYAKMKNAELEALLKQRSLPHTGKKAEMVARLQEADKADADKEPSTATPAPTTTRRYPFTPDFFIPLSPFFSTTPLPACKCKMQS